MPKEQNTEEAKLKIAADSLNLEDPDCLKCLRTKLRANSVGVFFRDEVGWRLTNFQAEKPSDHAEIDFYCLLTNDVPDIVQQHQGGLLLRDDESIKKVFGDVESILSGNSVIAAPVQYEKSVGVRIAWRDNSDPFTEEELRIMQCFGECPADCL